MHTKKITIVALTALLAAGANAQAKSSQKFETTLQQEVNAPVKVEVVVSQDLANRAENLPESLRDRRNFRSNSGFANNGYYGERELDKLTDRLQSRMEKRLAKEGVAVDDNAGTVLRLVIKDARNNRPTFKQMSKEPGLSFRSFGTGGATLEAEIIAAGGTSLGTMSYAWYETNIEDAAYGGTWSDAYRAFDRFTRKVADELE